ncbi:MAG TPA: hypothetical protein VLE43_01680 [Candidatus Saccharimonadia bacterium]|nr:hypothetical protein [Candidatus Saccharimonadia bacterium]
MRSSLAALSALALAGTCVAVEPKFFTDALSDEDLMCHRYAEVLELQRRLGETRPEKTEEGTTYHVFYCTLYYTPKESGFTAERGFDVTPVAAPGLGGLKLPKSFLQAVKMEGFGRLKEPVKERSYIRYAGGGRYAFAKAPLGSRGNVLVLRQSCAISSRNPYLRHRMILHTTSPTVHSVTGSTQWHAADTGGGIHPLQIDLYWGEDEPLGALGRERARPAGTRMEYAFDVVVKVKSEE